MKEYIFNKPKFSLVKARKAVDISSQIEGHHIAKEPTSKTSTESGKAISDVKIQHT